MIYCWLERQLLKGDAFSACDKCLRKGRKWVFAVSEEFHEELEAATTEKVKDLKDNISDKLKGLGK